MTLNKLTKLVCCVWLLGTGVPLAGDANASEVPVPTVVVEGLAYLLRLVGPGEVPDLQPALAENVLEFVAAAKDPAARFQPPPINEATPAYFEFDIAAGLDLILQYAYSPSIPSPAVMPSSVRLSHWMGPDLQKQPHPDLSRLKATAPLPLMVRGTEHLEITPDLFSGAYYSYDEDKTFVLMRYGGQEVMISLSRQRSPSEVGHKGQVLGEDDDWNYFYSGLKGLSMPGLGWVKSHMFDAFAVMVYIQQESPNSGIRTRCGIFKWLRAGWADMNLVRSKHVYRGLQRYAGSFKRILEFPALPPPGRLAATFASLDRMPLAELKTQSRTYFKRLADRSGGKNQVLKKEFAELLAGEDFLKGMSREEMAAIQVLEHMKFLLRKNRVLDGRTLLDRGISRR
jgi:hypothetical protein